MAVIIALSSLNTYSGERFKSSYSCSDIGKSCVSKGIRIVDGENIYRDCWEFGYDKTCSYPSKNNCSDYAHCYSVAIRQCLLTDSLGNCVNQLKEFSCKRWEPALRESQKVRIGLEEKDGPEGLICKGIPCIDGNCVDKSYMTNGEMMDSISKLYIVSEGKGATDMGYKIFEGYNSWCGKKATQYTNCCSVSMGGWGKNLGAKCTKDEQTLLDNRKKNICVYVGKEGKQTLGFTTFVKHHWCCFENILHKVVQVEGRKQLYAKGLMNLEEKEFGKDGKTICRGLTLEELSKLDFDRMDLREFIEDFKAKFYGQYKAPNIADMEARVKGTLPDIRRYDGDPNNHENNLTGWSGKVKDDSYEATEERLFEEEKRRAEEEKRLAEVREIEAKKQRKLQKEQEVAKLRDKARADRDKLWAFDLRPLVQATAGWWPAGAGLSAAQLSVINLSDNKVLYNPQQFEAKCGHLRAFKDLKSAYDIMTESWNKWVREQENLQKGNY